jgi:hypothetical protein
MNILDKILNEWSYRILDGTPDVDNQVHLNVLRKVMTGMGMNLVVVEEVVATLQTRDLFVESSKAPNKKSPIQKARSKDIENIINYLTSNNIFDQNIIDQMLSLVQRDQVAYYKLIDKISDVNIDKKYAVEVADAAFSFPNPEKFVTYIDNRSLKISSLHGKTLQSALKSTGINLDFLKWLINYQWVGSPAVGSGEAALAILLDGGSMATGAGDITVHGKPVEVKGSGGRLRGQHGFQEGLTAGRIFQKELESLIAKKYPKNAKSIAIPKAGGTEYNMTKGNWAIDKIGSFLIKNSSGNITSKDIKRIWQVGLEQMYVGIKGKALGFLKKAIDQVGSDGIVKDKATNGKFKSNLLSANMQHYMDGEGFDTIIILDRSGKLAVVQNKDVQNILSKVSISAAPSFTSKASTQGAVFQIKI